MENKEKEAKLFDQLLNTLQSKISDYQNGINKVNEKLSLMADFDEAIVPTEDLGEYKNTFTIASKIEYMTQHMHLINLRLERAENNINKLV